MFINKTLTYSDYIGAFASGLCVIHCIATPFLFVLQSCSVTGCCSSGPGWWSFIDYLFIGITFFAVYYSAKNTSKDWMKYALYSSWLLLTILMLNEKVGVFPLAEMWKYTAAFTLVGLHLGNRKYCRCNDESCCVA